MLLLGYMDIWTLRYAEWPLHRLNCIAVRQVSAHNRIMQNHYQMWLIVLLAGMFLV